MLCAAPVLQFPDPKLPYIVVTDASGTATGGVLMQDQGDGLRPLAFLSRQLKPTEQRYSAYERELGCSCILPNELATLFGGMSRRRDGGYRSSATRPTHGTTSAIPGTDQMDQVGAVSIDLRPQSSISLGKPILSPML